MPSSFLSSKAFLKRANQLQEFNLYPNPFVVGTRIARGFADLGMEEFCVIGANKTVSLLNGKVSEIPEGHEKFFFVVPSFSQMVQSLATLGFDIAAVNYREQRSWEVQFKDTKSGQEFQTESDEIECALAEALLKVSAKG